MTSNMDNTNKTAIHSVKSVNCRFAIFYPYRNIILGKISSKTIKTKHSKLSHPLLWVETRGLVAKLEVEDIVAIGVLTYGSCCNG